MSSLIKLKDINKYYKVGKEKFHVLRIDPYVKNSYLLEEVIDKTEMVITLVAHDQFINISAKLPDNIVYLDFTGRCK